MAEKKNDSSRAKPFVKWAGGKTQLLEKLVENLPLELREGRITTYCEPFVGSGALFFALTEKIHFEKIYLNDANESLMLAYDVVKREVEALIKILEKLEAEYLALSQDDRKKRYYEIRKKFNSLLLKNDDDAVLQTAYFIFLNKTCFNGLYRVNSKGLFNVPAGSYVNPRIADVRNLEKVSEVLQNAVISSFSFEKICEQLNDNSFVYFDPPYRPISKTSNFTSYASDVFDDGAQIRLGEIYKKLSEKDIKVLLSNSDPKNINPADNFFDELYSGFNIERVKAKRAINSKSSKRGEIFELLIKNY